MAKHIYLETAAPSSAPVGVGHHWVNTSTKDQWISVGTSAVTDWYKIPNVLNDGQVNILDNQASPVSITGLALAFADYQNALVQYTILRTDGTDYRRETGLIYMYYDSQNGWAMSRDSKGVDALNSGAGLTITAGGQIQYISDAMGGTYAGKISWKFLTKTVSEGI